MIKDKSSVFNKTEEICEIFLNLFVSERKTVQAGGFSFRFFISESESFLLIISKRF